MCESGAIRNITPYNREYAVDYAHRWAYRRNARYLNFDSYGGDCTNFASQCIYAGSRVMNYTPVYGWYYSTSYDRTASWTGVDYIYNFLVNNKGIGPFAEQVDIKDVKPGDIVQLSFQGGGSYNHSPVIVETGIIPDENNIRVATHTDDVDNYPLTGYEWKEIRFIHILGIRK